MSRFTTVTWVCTLVVAIVGVVPTAIVHLHRLLTAARNIEQYTADILEAGAGIANNTACISNLSDTIAGATAVIAGAESIERSTATIEQALAGAAAVDDDAVGGPGQ